LESFIDLCIWKLSGFDDLNNPTPFILTKHMSVPQKLDVVGTLCEQLEQNFPTPAGYKEVLGLVRSAQASRNRFVHDGLTLNTDTGMVEMASGSARGSLKTRIDTVNLNDLKRTAIEIHTANLALYKLVLRREPKPIWEIRRKTT